MSKSKSTIVKKLVILFGSVVGVVVVGFLVLVGKMALKEYSTTPEQRAAQNETENEMAAELQELEENNVIENGITIEGLEPIGDGIPSLEGLDFDFPGAAPSPTIVDGDESSEGANVADLPAVVR